MNVKAFFIKNWIHFAVVAFILILAAIYFKPQVDGYGLKQHDVEQWLGATHETDRFRGNTGEEALWTNSLFGGMPSTQISVMYPGNYIKQISNFYSRSFPGPMGIVIMHLIGFYILALFLRINPLIGVIGAIAFSFASYEIVIIQAGHLTKAMATAFMAPVLGAFIYSYRSNRMWGIAFSAFFMALELAANHVQVTYYFIFVLIFVGVYFLIDSLKQKKIKSFIITSVGLLAVYLLAFAVNVGNIALTADYAKNTIRGGNDININPDGTVAKNQSVGLDKDYITQWSYGKGETFTLISPNIKGGGSFAIGGSPFQEVVEASDLSAQDQNEVLRSPAYWGEQPFTSGPSYVGAITLFFAFLGLVFLKTRMKWALFAVTVLAIMLSWGKNFMGLTDFFIDYIPGYNKFRTVTIILVLVELCIPILGMLFLDQLIKERENFKEKKKQFLIAIGVFVFSLLVVKVAGLGDNYSSKVERDQIANMEVGIKSQLSTMDPQALKTQYNVDASDPAQIDAFVAQIAETNEKKFENLKLIRHDIYNSSMNRTLLFVFFAGLLTLLFLYTSIPSTALALAVLALTMMDTIPIAYQYLGAQEEGNKLKYWVDSGLASFPISATAADEKIMENELSLNPTLKPIIEKAKREGSQKANDLGYTGLVKKNVVDSYRFSALNFETSYRVFDMNGGFQSNRASYLHKSLGGYHGAKLRNINNLFDFHLSKMNNKVYDMLNVKYFMQQDESGVDDVRPNPTAMGNAWLVQRIEKYATPNEEIRGLGSEFKIVNKGQGQFLVNYEQQKEATVYGAEKLQYLIPGKDTIDIPLSNGMTEGTEAMFVMDINGRSNLVPMSTMSLDTAKSFISLVSIKLMNEFKPREEAIMLTSEAAKLSASKFSGEGSINLLSYAPNKLVYKVDVKGKQLAVFSEVYYPEGWNAFVDGKEVEILKVNYLLRGLELTNGKHTIEFKYDNSKYLKVNNVARIGSILLFLLFGITIFYSWKKKKNQA